MKTDIKNRDVGVDLVKFLAIFGVIVIHTCNYGAEIGTPNWAQVLFWGSITRSSVPLFLMASGAVMLNSEKELTLKKLYLKNILRIIVAMVVWGIAYKVYHLIDLKAFSLSNLWQGIKEVLVFNQEFHFYYMHMILLVYVFLPVTRLITEKASEKQLRYMLLLWFMLAIVYSTLKPFWPFTLFGGMTTQWSINLTYSSIGYGILGYYIKKYGLPKGADIIMALAGFLFMFLGTYYMSEKQGYLYEHFLEGIGIGAALLGTGIFGIANRVKISSQKLKSVIIWFSKASFCIYLVHVMILYIMKDNGITVDFAPYIISIPVIALGIMILSSAVYAILSNIPIIKKWLV